VGISVLSAENLLSGSVWRWFMADGAVPRAMQLVGFDPAPNLAKQTPAPPQKTKPSTRKRASAKAS